MIKLKSAFIHFIVSLIYGIEFLFNTQFMKATFQFNEKSDNWLQILGCFFLSLCFGIFGIASYGNRKMLNLCFVSNMILGAGTALMVFLAILPPNLYYFGLSYLFLALTSLIEIRYGKI